MGSCMGPDKEGNTPLHLATLHNNRDDIQILIERGSNLNQQNDVRKYQEMVMG